MLINSLLIFMIAVSGYILFTLLPFYLFTSTSRFDSAKINTKETKFNSYTLKHDIQGTFNTFIIIGLFSIILALQIDTIWNNLYFSIQEKGWIYYFISLSSVILLHDAYFFFTHYLMHQSKWLFKFHLYHHKSHSPTPFCVFSFHPVEGILHFIFFSFIAFLPIHYSVMILFYVWMLVCNTIGHLNLDLYPKAVFTNKLTRWWNSPTHHYMHHQYVDCNFSIYYNHWDRLFKTNHKDNYKNFFKIKRRQLRFKKMPNP